MTTSNDVRDNRAESRYETSVDGGLAIAAYRLDGTTVTFTHTEVPDASRGQGVATRLIGAALDDVAARGLHIVPRCSAVAAYVRAHPGREALLSAEGRAVLAASA